VSKCIIFRYFKRSTKIVKHIPKNNEIRAKEVRLINEETGEQNVVSIADALKFAADREMDLVAISHNAVPPVCKVMDYSHYLYDQNKREKKVRKNSKSNVLKELKLSSKISENDFQVRLKAAFKFLEKGYKVKVSLLFRGREITHSELGMSVMKRFGEELLELATVDQAPSMNGRFVNMLLIPKKK